MSLLDRILVTKLRDLYLESIVCVSNPGIESIWCFHGNGKVHGIKK